MLPGNVSRDKHVQFAATRPSDRVQTHHIHSFRREPGSKCLERSPSSDPFAPKRGGGGGASIGDSLGGYGPGTVPDTLRPGQAILVKAGSDLVLQLHYTANGKEADDTSKVGLIFAKEKPTARLAMLSATNFKIAIPPNDPNYEVSAKVTLQRDA